MLFIKANNLSGAFLWSMDLDDYDGKHCSQGSYPLLRAIKAELSIQDRFEKTENHQNSACKNRQFLNLYILLSFLIKFF